MFFAIINFVKLCRTHSKMIILYIINYIIIYYYYNNKYMNEGFLFHDEFIKKR